MQILINLRATDSGVENKEESQAGYLYELLIKLQEQGYSIHSLYGSLIYDLANGCVIDAGEPGDNLPASLELAKSIFSTGAKMAVIFVEEKYIAFSNSYMPAICFGQGKKRRPISLGKAIQHFDDLCINLSTEVLDSLYRRQFEEFREAKTKLA